MKNIFFPGLGLDFNVNSVAFKVFEIDVYWYAILIVLAFIIGILLCKKDNGKYNINFDNVLELFIIIIPISIICARIYFIIFKLEYYLQEPQEIFNLRDGGLAIYGGIIGAIIAVVIYCKRKNINVLDMLDYIVPYLPLGQAIRKMGKLYKL